MQKKKTAKKQERLCKKINKIASLALIITQSKMKCNFTERLAPNICLVLYPVVEFVKNFTTGYNYSAIKLFWLKHKRVILIVIAIIFLVVIFLTKTNTIFKNGDPALQQADGLVYQNSEIGELVSKDTDGDEIFDWEEGLWGTNPTKKDTDDDGITDDAEIALLKADTVGTNSSTQSANVKLTETDKFSQELLTTMTSLAQGGSLDEATVEKIGISLADNIENSIQRKIYTLSNLKISSRDTTDDVLAYNLNLYDIYKENKSEKGFLNILEELIADPENTSILAKFDPIINKNKKIINELLKISVPQSLAKLHLELINTSQGIIENISDIKLINNDPLVTMGAIMQYEQNVVTLESIAIGIDKVIFEKLNN